MSYKIIYFNSKDKMAFLWNYGFMWQGNKLFILWKWKNILLQDLLTHEVLESGKPLCIASIIRKETCCAPRREASIECGRCHRNSKRLSTFWFGNTIGTSSWGEEEVEITFDKNIHVYFWGDRAYHWRGDHFPNF